MAASSSASSASRSWRPSGSKSPLDPWDDAAAAEFALGARLRAYQFDKYKSKKPDAENGDDREPIALNLALDDSAAGKAAFAAREAVAEGVELARNLVNEPPNVLFPETFAERASQLEKLGVQIETLDVKAMEKLGMGALLAVGRGSARESRLVAMRWRGAKSKKTAPIAFVGKGVTFDTGGISIKPAAGMEDMKGDMAGAACVVGLMHALARRKAKVNAIGVIGIVENMPDGMAYRPGDILTSMSGQTIEVINTDAEGRLVLADALWWVKETAKPKLIIDLATLTGAIIVALGQEHAGLFSNNDELAERLLKAGEATGEAVWRMPLGAAYDKHIDSKVADMKNTGGRHGGSITAAQFLKRFVGDVPWAHLDIAGAAMNSPAERNQYVLGVGVGRSSPQFLHRRALRGLTAPLSRREGDDAVGSGSRVRGRIRRARAGGSRACAFGLRRLRRQAARRRPAISASTSATRSSSAARTAKTPCSTSPPAPKSTAC